MLIMKKILGLIMILFLTACASSGSSKSEFSANDIMFAQMMIPHHEQAIEMSELALKNSQDPEILALAEEIRAAQAPEIEDMKTWGTSHMGSHAGHMMDGMLSDDEMEALTRAQGSEFDRLFLEGMIKHHEGAIEMADMILDSESPRASALGKAIVATQQAEIEKMKELLNR